MESKHKSTGWWRGAHLSQYFVSPVNANLPLFIAWQVSLSSLPLLRPTLLLIALTPVSPTSRAENYSEFGTDVSLDRNVNKFRSKVLPLQYERFNWMLNETGQVLSPIVFIVTLVHRPVRIYFYILFTYNGPIERLSTEMLRLNHTIIGFNKYFCRAFITEFGIELCKIMELTEFYTISNHTI